MNSLLNPAKSCLRGIFMHRTHIRHVSRSTRLLNSSKDQGSESEREKVWKQQRIVQDEMYEPDPALASGKTAVTILNKEQDSGILFDSFSSVGFLLNNGFRVMGPCAAFPKSVLHWNIKGVEDINQESLALFTILEPKIDILVLGVGARDNLKKIDPKIISYLRSQRISVEILATEQALTTFNFLNQEARYVAGAFLPPDYLEVAEIEDGNRAGLFGQEFNMVEIDEEQESEFERQIEESLKQAQRPIGELFEEVVKSNKQSKGNEKDQIY